MISLEDTLRALANPVIADKQSRYLRGQFPFLGIPTPTARKITRTFFRQNRPEDWRKTVKMLWSHPERELHYAALDCARLHCGEPADLTLYKELITSHSWWDTVDTIAPHLVGNLLLRHPELTVKIDAWIDSDNLWLRRSSLIYSLYWKQKTDSARLFATCTKLSGDPDFFIRKAIGWALRSYSKTNPSAVRAYLSQARLSPLSAREGGKYCV